jgi:hypothetical protein
MTTRKTYKTTGTLVTFIERKSQENTRKLSYNISNPTAKPEHSSQTRKVELQTRHSRNFDNNAFPHHIVSTAWMKKYSSSTLSQEILVTRAGMWNSAPKV